MNFEDEKDYIMRMIKEMVRVLFSLMFGKKYVSVEQEAENKYEVSGKKLNELLEMIDNGEINEAEKNRAEYILYNKLDDIHDVILVYDNDVPVGSASFKKYDDDCAEVKRVFIKEEYRGRGISKKLMELLEDAARKKGYCYLILESGEPLIAAMALYRKIGYEVIPNYGQYKDMKDSICMRKTL